jgi:chaperonin cofactor prefoldin
MGSFCSKWAREGLTSCTSWRTGEEDLDVRSLERKLQQMEQRMDTMELRLNTTEEANQRLHNKWNGVEDRFQQQQGDLRMLAVRCRTMEQRLDSITFDHCERLDDDIIVVEES